MPNGHDHDTSRWSSLDWAQWRGEIGKSLAMVESCQTAMQATLQEVRDEVIRMKAQAAIIGAGGGGIVGGLAAALVEWFKKG